MSPRAVSRPPLLPPAPSQPEGILAALAESALADVESHKLELQAETDRRRVARFQFEIGRIAETVMGDIAQATTRYASALAADPEFLPALIAARRLMMALGDYEHALALLKRETELSSEPRQTAALHFLQGQMLEDHLRRPVEARVAYDAASSLLEDDPILLEAQVRFHESLEDWTALGDTFGRLAGAVTKDPRHRAITLVRRARLAEVRGADPDLAAQLYEAALAIDGHTPTALEALKRLHQDRKRWRELMSVLEREAEQTTDVNVRTMALYRIGQLNVERLGNRDEGIQALELAAEESPGATFVLDALAQLYERAGSYPELANALSRLAEATPDHTQRVGYLHRIGDLCRDRIEDDEAAIQAYEAALELDPTYVPALRALAPLYEAAKRWDDLVRMHEAEVRATMDTPRRAATHARVAVILERIGKPEAAAAHHEQALSLVPDLTDSFRALIRLYTRADEHHKLIELYERAIGRVDAERGIEFLFAIGDLYNGPLQDHAQAVATYRRILERNARHLGAVHALQRTAESAAMYRELVTALELEADIVEDPKEIVDLRHRAATLLRDELNATSEAIVMFKRVLELDTHHRATLASLGRIYYGEGFWADLAVLYKLELDLAPDPASQVALLYKMGELHNRFLGQVDRAVTCFRQALKANPVHGPSLHALSAILRKRADWPGLATLWEEEYQHTQDAETRSQAAHRSGQIYEDHLNDKNAAERAYARAVVNHPGDQPAAEALDRLRAQLEHWTSLAQDLEERANSIPDPTAATALLVRAAETWWDRLRDADGAIRCYQQVLAKRSDHLASLIAIEPIYRAKSAWTELAETLAAQEKLIEDPRAKAGVLSERIRILERYDPGSDDELRVCYERLLVLRPDDRLALEGLARVAIRTSNVNLLADVDARLAVTVSGDVLRSTHLTRRGEALELAGHSEALAVYRSALALDSANRAAQRGLARVATRARDPQSLAEAVSLEAEQSTDPVRSAAAWVRSGVIRREQLNDRKGAVEAFEKALSLNPNDEAAASHLTRAFRESGDLEILAERLARAAAEAKDEVRQRTLWMQVSDLYRHELSNMGAAIEAVRRLCEAQPKNVTALFEQGKLLVSDRRYDEAVALLDKGGGKFQTDAHTRFEIHALVAKSYDALEDRAAAFNHYVAALELQPEDHGCLLEVAKRYLEQSGFRQARDPATRLVQVARNDRERADALILLARAQTGLGERGDALDHLAEAATVGGLTPDLRERVAVLAIHPELWQRYVSALERGFEGGPPVHRPSLYLEVARIRKENLGDREGSLTSLIEGLRVCNGDATLRLELALRLKDDQRLDEAIEQFQYLLMDDVTRSQGWRGLSECFDAQGRNRERDLTACALTVLGEADRRELERVERWVPAANRVPALAFTPDATAELFVLRSQQAPAAALLSSITEGLARLRAPELAKYGVGFRDKLAARSDSPLRVVIDHVAQAMGVEELDVYLHREPNRGVEVEHYPRPILIVPERLSGLPHSRQVFHLAYVMFNIARGVHAIQRFTPQELGIALVAATRTIAPEFGAGVAAPDILDDRGRQIVRGISRRKRKSFEQAAETYALAKPLEPGTFVQWVEQTARRVALVFADDLVGSIAEQLQLEGAAPSRGLDSVQASPVVTDLMKIWVSKPAMRLRTQAGMLS